MLEKYAINLLLSLSSLFSSFQTSPNPSNVHWTTVHSWQANANGTQSYEATSTEILRECSLHRSSFIDFPSVVLGAHEISIDNKKILSFGDSSFKSLRSFYGAPILSCAGLSEGSELEWTAYSSTAYFARLHELPKIVAYPTYKNVISETLNIIAFGTLIVMALFTLVIFWGKVPHKLTISLTLSYIFVAIYVVCTVPFFFNIYAPALYVQKTADISLWIGMSVFLYAVLLQGIISPILYLILLFHTVIACFWMIMATSGDSVQFGVSIPFGYSTVLILLCFLKLAVTFIRSGRKRTDLFLCLSFSFFFYTCSNDILVITGIVNGFMIFSSGAIGVLLFFALSVNEKINETFRERDYLRANLQIEVERKTEELKSKTNQLEIAMGDLKETQAELVQSAKLASLGTLSAGIAHEINNSLNYVYGSLAPLEKIVDGFPQHPGTEKVKRLIGIMQDGLRLTFGIVRSLRNYTGLNQAPLNDLVLSELFDSVFTILRSKISDAVSIKRTIPIDLKVYGSVVGLHQVFMNLISNALDAMPNGGEIQVSAEQINSITKITICDTGMGMSSDIKERIFEPFFTTKKVGSGTGLGLHIVRNEIERHHGTISVESIPGKGTTFNITLPSQERTVTKEAA